MNFIVKIETAMTKAKFKGCKAFLMPRVSDTDCGVYCKTCKRNHYCSKCGNRYLQKKAKEQKGSVK